MPGRGRRPVNSSPRGAPAWQDSPQAPSATDLLRPAPLAPRRVAPVAAPLGVGAGGGLALAPRPERGGGVGRAAIAHRSPAELERRGEAMARGRRPPGAQAPRAQFESEQPAVPPAAERA